MQYNVNAEHNRHFELTDENGNLIGRLDYPSWFTTKAEITACNIKYRIEPSNFWQTAMHLIRDDGQKILEFRRDWRANIIITLNDGRSYMLKRNGFWMRNFIMITQDEQEILQLESHFDWSALRFKYQVQTANNISEANDPVILLTIIYCCNYQHSHGAGTT